MTYFRSHGARFTYIILSVVGVAISIYLTMAHYEQVPVVCSTSGIINCERVLSSSYSVVPGTSIPISVPGLIWFLVSGALAFAAWKIWPAERLLKIIETIWFSTGVLTALYLVYVELVYLHNICAWCTVLHIIILVMFLVAVFQLMQHQLHDEDYYEDEEEAEIPQVSGRAN
ncbi:vitamin K epoxide reductase family protein [Dictyobacter formicarum]|uniref:Vitamin K epoxide reductase domain-containing protein n=1 Tax=Dictyobacter formicarum TaxID=2778368 RepID=A0ABQ3VUH3_9CHLR|nr:vitamin K epoxide reductase family protein [Dictyobacter formicarum]GHO89043.1 hypothetical protein KSZ_70490 [Dictyobacter formicarum]